MDIKNNKHLIRDEKGNLVEKRVIEKTEDIKKSIVNRASTIAGHMVAIKEMIINDRSSEEILNQLSAVSSSTNQLKKAIIKGDLQKAIARLATTGDILEIKKINEMINKLK